MAGRQRIAGRKATVQKIVGARSNETLYQRGRHTQCQQREYIWGRIRHGATAKANVKKATFSEKCCRGNIK